MLILLLLLLIIIIPKKVKIFIQNILVIATICFHKIYAMWITLKQIKNLTEKTVDVNNKTAKQEQIKSR